MTRHARKPDLQDNPDDPETGRGHFYKVQGMTYKKLLILSVFAFCLFGCSSLPTGTPPGAVVGRYDRYDYTPSVIQTGNLQQFWWCGRHSNPDNASQDSDTILYESINVVTHVHVGPTVVLGETPGAWDSLLMCNPHVVQGAFTNPLGDGITYKYALYYVGTANGNNNSIGVAFSMDGVSWKKYPTPVVPFTSPVGYGPAQPVPYNSDQRQAIWLFYEDSSDPRNHHTQATSTDGIHFTTVGTITTNGLDVNNPSASWGDMAYDQSSKFWYATYNLASRDPSTTASTVELGSLGIQLYRIPADALLSGRVNWQLIKNFDTNLTGYESVFLAAILRDPFGNLYPEKPFGVQLFPSFSNPQPAWNASPGDAAASADPSRWDIGSLNWSAAENPLVDLNRYENNTTHLVTSGWTDPNGDFVLEQSLGRLYEGPQNGAITPLYGCKNGNTDYFVSLDPACESRRILGINGYLYSQSVPGLNLVAIYRCATATDHFVSQQANCEGATAQFLLGYIFPPAPSSSSSQPPLVSGAGWHL
jgi:hypothetical protein